MLLDAIAPIVKKVAAIMRTKMQEYHMNFTSVFNNFDKNNDGKIEPDEIPERMRRFVDRLDTNGDGTIDEKELDNIDLLGRRRR